MVKLIHADNNARTRFQETARYEGGLYDLGHQAYAWIVPNGSWGESNAGLVVGEGESLLIDTLWDVPYTHSTMLDAMQSITANAPIETLVNTHADGDHFFGNELLSDKTIITSKASYEEMLTTKPQSMLLLGRIGAFLNHIPLFEMDKAGHWFKNMVAPYDFAGVAHTPANETFEGEKQLDIGGRKVELIEVGSAHTMGDLIVHVPSAKTLFSADILFIGSTPVMWAGPIENWFAALDRILAMDVETIMSPDMGLSAGKTKSGRCNNTGSISWSACRHITKQVYQRWKLRRLLFWTQITKRRFSAIGTPPSVS